MFFVLDIILSVILILLFVYVGMWLRGPKAGKLTVMIRGLEKEVRYWRKRAMRFEKKQAVVLACFVLFMLQIVTIPSISELQNETSLDGFPVGGSILSAEGDLSSDSILSFSETTADDVMFYPDAFYNDTVVKATSRELIQYTESNDHEATWTDDTTYYQTWETGGNEANGAECRLNFTIPTGLQVEAFEISVLGKWYDVSGTPTINIVSYYDYLSASWIDYDDFESSYSWYNTSTIAYYDDSVNNPLDQIAMRFVLNYSSGADTIVLDYAEVTFYVMTLADSNHYAESFADVSDWTVYADRTFSTDGDVLSVEFASTEDWNQGYTDSPSITLSGVYYLEIRYRGNVTISDMWIRLYSADGHSGSLLQTIKLTDPTTSWNSYKALITTSTTIECVVFTGVAASNANFQVDYIRIGPADEMGWQHDCSTMAGFGYQTGKSAIVFSSDGDLITCNPSGDDARVEIQFDTTATQTKVSEDYYAFIEFSISSVTDGDSDGFVWRFRAFESIMLYSTFFNDWTDETGVFRVNLDAWASDYPDDIDEVEYFKFYLDDADDVIVFDYIKFYSIADFSLVLSGDTINDFLFVDSNVLYGEVDSGYIQLNDDSPLSINGGTYNVWNITTGSSPINFRHYDGTQSAWSSGETRGTSQTGTITGCNVKFESDGYLSAIKFWEDAIAPTIENVWATPYSPTDIDDVTLSVFTADWTDLYEVTLNAIDSPAGFNDIDYDCVQNSEETDLWVYTFDDADLPAGYYAFQAIANDGANTGTGLLIFRVISVFLQVTDIVLITATDTLAQISGYINKDSAYNIYENDSSVGSGSVSDGWFSISWTKDTTAGSYVEIGIKFVSGTYTEWVNGSYSVASAAILYVTNPVYTATDDKNYLSGHLNLDTVTWTAYDDDVQQDTGSLNTGSFSINWDKLYTAGLHEWGVKFDDGTTVRWVNGTYEPVRFAISDIYVMQNNESIILGGKFMTVDLSIDYTIYEDGVGIDSGTLDIPASGDFYVVKWTKSSSTSVANWTLVMQAGGVNITIYGYNLLIEDTDYTYNSSGQWKEENYYVGESEEVAAARASEAMWDTASLIIVLLTIPFVVGIGIKIDRKRGRSGKRDRANDKFRSN